MTPLWQKVPPWNVLPNQMAVEAHSALPAKRKTTAARLRREKCMRFRNFLADAEQQNAKALGRKEIPFRSPKDAQARSAAPTHVAQCRFFFVLAALRFASSSI
jgi:hypothetical protein